MGNMNILSPLCLQKLQNALPPFPLNSKIGIPYSPLEFPISDMWIDRLLTFHQYFIATCVLVTVACVASII